MTLNLRGSRLLSGWLLAAVATLALAAFVTEPRAQAQDVPEEVSDLLALSGAGGITIYIADAKKGAIYSYSLTAEDVASISLDKFRKFYASPNIKKPTALAYRNGKLLVCEKDSHALYEIELGGNADRNEKLLLQRGAAASELSPVSVAVSDSGAVAVGSERGQKISSYPSDFSGPGAALPSEEVDEPTRMFFVGPDLFVFDRDEHAIYKIAGANPSAPRPSPSPVIIRLQSVKDVAYRDGVFYLLRRQGVSVMAADAEGGPVDASETELRQAVRFDSTSESEFSRIAVTADRVFVGDNARRRIWVAAQPSFVSRLSLGSKRAVWLDELTRKIYVGRRPERSAQPAGAEQNLFDEVKVEAVWSGGALREPIGVTSGERGEVYVVDRKVAAIFNLTPGGEMSVVFAGAPLVAPTDVIAAVDVLYVIDPGARKLFSYDRASGSLTEEFDYAASSVAPDRLGYSQQSLVALDTRSKTLDRFIVGGGDKTPGLFAIDAFRPPPSPTPTPNSRAAKGVESKTTLRRGERIEFAKAMGRIADFSVADNIAYFIDDEQRRLVLLPLDGGAPTSVTYEGIARSPNVIAADADDIYLVDGHRRVFNRSQLVVPVGVSFEGDWTPEFLVRFYHYLLNRKLLDTKPHKVEQPTSLEDLAVNSDVMPTGYVDEFQPLFCRLNEGLCKEWQEKGGQAGTPRPGATPVVPAGTTILLPNLRMDKYSARRGVRLPLDLTVYRPTVFRQYVNGPLGDLASEFAPDDVKPGDLGEVLRSLNPEYVGDNILAERKGFFIIPIQAVKTHAVVPKADLLDKESVLSKIVAKEEIITGFSPAFRSEPQSAMSACPAAPPARTSPAPVPPDEADGRCRVIDPDVLSNAMRLVRYCMPNSVLPGKVVHVAVLDNHFNAAHPVFSDPTPAEPPTVDVYVEPNATSTRTPIRDLPRNAPNEFLQIDHGTHMAALIGARKQASAMVGFMPQAKLYGVEVGDMLDKVMDRWKFLRLFNVSLGEETELSPRDRGGLFVETRPIIKFIRNNPYTLTVVAAGNDGREVQADTLASLGELDNVLVVGASNSPPAEQGAGELPKMTLLEKETGIGSNYHDTWVALVAPGENIKSALYNGEYGSADGTSQATALVTGAAAILMAVEPRWKIWQYKARLVASADLWPGETPDRKILAGNLNVQRAVLDTGVAVMDLDPNGICKGEIDESHLLRELEIRMPNGATSLKIPWKRILRVERSKDDSDLYTIIYYAHHRLEAGKGRKNFDVFRREVRVTDLLSNLTFRFNVPEATANCTSMRVSIKNLKYFLNTFYPSPDDEN